MTSQQKLSVARRLLRSGTLTVSLDPRRLGVTVPMRFRMLSQLDVRASRSTTGVDDEGVTGYVRTMDGERIGVDLPWYSVYALTSDGDPTSGRIWFRDVPPELKERLAATAPGQRRMIGVVDRIAPVVCLKSYRDRKAGST